MQVKDMFNLERQFAFVTGAAKGLGFAMSEAVAEQGATVMMTDIDPAALSDACARLTARGLKVHSEIVDVADIDILAKTIDATAARFGQLDIVFANAGLSGGPGPLTEAGAMANVDLARWNTLLQINLTSVFVTIRTAAAHMVARRSGRIIVTASIAGLSGERMCGYSYVATKAAVTNLVRQAAIELSPHNVNINAIAPGPFLTDIGQGRLHQAETASQFTSEVLMGRLAQPDEIKGLALLLASQASSFITGTVIPIDGGATAW